jgi:hypothetical protein
MAEVDRRGRPTANFRNKKARPSSQPRDLGHIMPANFQIREPARRGTREPHMTVLLPNRQTAAKFVLIAMCAIASPAIAHAQQHPDSIVVRASQAIAPLKDSTALGDAGFRVIGVATGSRDLTPFQGQHWISMTRFAANEPPDLTKPTFMMYLPLGDSLLPIGVAYTKLIRMRPVPTSLAGTPMEWHLHALCRGIPGEGIQLADGRDDCIARGGQPLGANIAMVHAWTIPNPDGPYAHDNPALPFIATGLTPPTHATRDDRLFGVALGETYGAKLVVAHRIDDLAARAGKNSGLVAERAALTALVPQLRDAQRAHDAKKFDALRKAMIDRWNALADEYRALAPTPELRARFDVELNQALDTMGHMHM